MLKHAFRDEMVSRFLTFDQFSKSESSEVIAVSVAENSGCPCLRRTGENV
jgi:hypothetical protein